MKSKNCSVNFKGLLILSCDCGHTAVMYSKNELTSYVCKSCGKVHNLSDSQATFVSTRCECGNRINAVTNITKPVFEFECKCGYPLAVEYNKHKNKYFGMR